MKTRVSPRIFFPLAFFLAGLCVGAEGNDAAIARIYFQEAQSLYASGAPDAASRALSTSLEYAPDSSDSLYLMALIRLSAQEGTREGLSLIRKARSRRTWLATDPDEVSRTYATVLVRTGAASEAVPLLERLTARRPENAEDQRLLAAAYMESGDLARAEKTAAVATKLFPAEESLPLLAAEIAVRRGQREAARAAVSAGLRALPHSLPLLLRSAQLEPEPPRRLRSVDAYISREGTDPLAAVVALEAGAADPGTYFNFFIAHGGLSRLELLERVSLVVAGIPELAGKLKDELSRYSGNRDLLDDSGRFYRERWEIANGMPVQWIRDPDADGLPQFRAAFKDGRLDTLTSTARKGGAETFTVLVFDEYPYLSSVSHKNGAGTRSYSLVPRALGCSLLDRNLSFDPSLPRIATRFLVPTDDQVQDAANRMEEYGPDSVTLLRRVEMARGEPLYMEESTRADGIVDHKLWYAEGVPLRGLRDLAEDGRWQAAESYSGGTLEILSVDTDGDGKPDYSEVFAPVPVKLWDYNGDGVPDARESTTRGGAVVREFSPKLDGRFDVKVTFMSGRILSVVKDGRTIGAHRDPARGITWIGVPREGFPADRTARDGLTVFRGITYLVFHYGDSVYVEELP